VLPAGAGGDRRSAANPDRPDGPDGLLGAAICFQTAWIGITTLYN